MRLTQYSFPTAVGLAGMLMFVAGCGQEPAEPTQASPASTTADATAGGDRYVVLFKQGKSGAAVSANALSTDMARLGGKIERNQADIGVMQVRLTAAAAAELKLRPDVQAVAKDKRVQWLPPGEVIPGQLKKITGEADPRNAAFFDFQWNMRQIKADKAWDVSNQGKGVLVCILDTGVDPRHIDLQGKVNLDISASFVATERADRDFDLHGTSMASIVAGNAIGMAPVAPEASLCSVKVLDKDGSGTFGDVTAGIMYVGDAGKVDALKRVQVANMSLGALVPSADPDVRALAEAMQRAIDYSTRKGVLFVASSGNDGYNLNNANFIHLPSSLNNVLSVGATGPINQRNFDHIASYSNTGQRGTDVFAPGGEFAYANNVLPDLILAACSASNRVFDCADGVSYIFEAGTSPATAHVSGQAAVIEAKLPGNQTPAELTACILHTADPLPNPARTANGRINVLKSLSCPA
jgi:subtilisin family serine protease